MSFILPWWWRWAALGLALVAAAAFGAVKMHEHDEKAYDALKQEYEAFKDQVRVNGLAAEAAAKKKAEEDKRRKDDANEENSRALATLADTVGRLRRTRPASSFVPARPAATSRPDIICFDRAEYQRTDGVFTAGARGLSDEGSKATVDLDSAKRWAQHQ